MSSSIFDEEGRARVRLFCKGTVVLMEARESRMNMNRQRHDRCCAEVTERKASVADRSFPVECDGGDRDVGTGLKPVMWRRGVRRIC